MKQSDDAGDIGFESDDSDVELQNAFIRGDLKPGLNVEVTTPKQTINNVAAMEAKLAGFYLDLSWVERLDQINDIALAVPGSTEVDTGSEGTTAPRGDSTDDDFQRELLFYRQAQGAVLDALPKLRKLGIPTRRPDDYFAEMAKSDVHMKKIRQKLLSKEMGMERSEKAKKMRELRKYGKRVQQNVLLQRQKEKRELIESVKKYRKGQIDKLDFLEDDEDKTINKRNSQTKNKKSGIKKKYKDDKFGFGGVKKGSKHNTTDSAAQDRMSKGRGAPRGKKGKANNKRPGKSTRQKMKANKRK